MKRRILLWLHLGVVAVVFITIANAGRNLAQNSFDIVVDVSNALRLSHFAWSFDNQTFAFLNNNLVREPISASVDLPQPAWQTFNVETQLLSPPQTHYPFQPPLSAEDLSLFDPSGLILAAPNNTLIAFTTAEMNNPYSLRFANLSTTESIVTPLRAETDPFFRANGLKGSWSETGNIFVYSQSNPFTTEPTYFQINVDEANLTDSSIRPFAPIIDGEVYVTFDGVVDRYLDMSADGHRILAIARRQASYGEPPYLVVWTSEQESNSFRIAAVQGQDVCDASFTQHDEAVIILLRDGRVLLYQLASRNVLELQITVPTDCSFLSEFSPNGAWVAVTDYANNLLHFYDIANLSTQSLNPLQPPVANAGVDLSLMDTDGDGIGELSLDGGASFDSDGQIISYVWSQGVAQQPEGTVQVLRFPVGTTVFTLTVTDNDGLVDVDDITVVLNPLPSTPEPSETAVPTVAPTASPTPSVGTVQLSGILAVVSLPSCPTFEYSLTLSQPPSTGASVTIHIEVIRDTYVGAGGSYIRVREPGSGSFVLKSDFTITESTWNQPFYIQAGAQGFGANSGGAGRIIHTIVTNMGSTPNATNYPVNTIDSATGRRLTGAFWTGSNDTGAGSDSRNVIAFNYGGVTFNCNQN